MPRFEAVEPQDVVIGRDAARSLAPYAEAIESTEAGKILLNAADRASAVEASLALASIEVGIPVRISWEDEQRRVLLWRRARDHGASIESRPALSWAEFGRARSDLVEAGRELLYFFGVGLAMLGTTRADGGPRVHPVSPLIADGRLLAFVIPSPKLSDLLRDGRYALHSYPLPENEDAFYLTGRSRAVSDPALQGAARGLYLNERPSLAPVALEAQTLFEFLVDACLLTRTDGHGDLAPRHMVWRSG